MLRTQTEKRQRRDCSLSAWQVRLSAGTHGHFFHEEGTQSETRQSTPGIPSPTCLPRLSPSYRDSPRLPRTRRELAASFNRDRQQYLGHYALVGNHRSQWRCCAQRQPFDAGPIEEDSLVPRGTSSAPLSTATPSQSKQQECFQFASAQHNRKVPHDCFACTPPRRVRGAHGESPLRPGCSQHGYDPYDPLIWYRKAPFA